MNFCHVVSYTQYKVLIIFPMCQWCSKLSSVWLSFTDFTTYYSNCQCKTEQITEGLLNHRTVMLYNYDNDFHHGDDQCFWYWFYTSEIKLLFPCVECAVVHKTSVLEQFWGLHWFRHNTNAINVLLVTCLTSVALKASASTGAGECVDKVVTWSSILTRVWVTFIDICNRSQNEWRTVQIMYLVWYL